MAAVKWFGAVGCASKFDKLRAVMDDPKNANSVITSGVDGSYSIRKLAWDEMKRPKTTDAQVEQGNGNS